MKKRIALLLCAAFLVSLIGTLPAKAAPEWPALPSIEAPAAILYEPKTGTVLYNQNANEKHFPASITKILTALIVLENCELDEMVTYSWNAVYSIEPGSSHIALSPGEEMSVRDSLYALMLASANDAANGLAEHVAGSLDAFAEMMNQRAAEIGCTNSHFVNAHGLHNENHYTTCYDMALIMAEAIKNPDFLEIASTKFYECGSTNLQPEHRYWAIKHKLISEVEGRHYEDAVAGKTGYTDEALNTLVTYGKRGDVELIVVTMNCHAGVQYDTTETLLNFGFNNFSMIHLSDYAKNLGLTQADFPADGDYALTADPEYTLREDGYAIVPNGGDYKDLTASVAWTDENGVVMGGTDHTHARVTYQYGERKVGYGLLDVKAEIADPGTDITDPSAENASGADLTGPAGTQAEEETSSGLGWIIWLVLTIILIALIVFVLVVFFSDYSRRKRRRNRRNSGGQVRYTYSKKLMK